LTRGSGITDRSGEATITTDLEGEVQVVVEAEGYKQQVKTVRIAIDGSYGKGRAATTLIMQPSTAEDLIEVTVLSAGKRNEGSVPLAGVKVMGGEESTTTNSYGQAKLRGTFAGNVEVAVERLAIWVNPKKSMLQEAKGPLPSRSNRRQRKIQFQ